MWVMTTFGFYSAVQHREDKTMLMVRTRTHEDAHELANRINGSVRPPEPVFVQHTPEADYPYRVVVPKLAFAWLLWKTASDIDYDNFKGAVAERQGSKRALVYAAVWAKLRSLMEPT